MEKLLITGAAGFLGSNVVWFARGKYNVIATSLHPIEMEGYTIEKLDITDRAACSGMIKKHKPDVVVHCSALTDLVACEERHEFADNVNVNGTRNLADACAKVDGRMILVSSDWVFDGKKQVGEKYSEGNAPSPVNYYGVTKVKAENTLKNSGARWIVARPANIYGNSFAIPKDLSIRKDHVQNRGGWVNWIINTLKEGQEILQPTDLYQTPTLASNFVEVVLQLHEEDKQGVFHVAGRSIASRYEFVLEMARIFELDDTLIKEGDIYAFAKSYGIDLKDSPMDIQEGLETMKTQRVTHIL
jgi:dTDP-4-dehydrorhamnose reductase